ncbi:hypothetical protein C1H46_032501 [Malus baccata]|uniref:Uncharacterized protein n=1 Tax=Malus baccata TaxID=106549 RepID=A0A540L654_MALBA|nr:hypothetical protein C1H46_032501 [Malus baccata]
MGTLGRAIYTVGFWIRETGQAIDRLGSSLQGSYYFKEQRAVWFAFRIDFDIAAVELA